MALVKSGGKPDTGKKPGTKPKCMDKMGKDVQERRVAKHYYTTSFLPKKKRVDGTKAPVKRTSEMIGVTRGGKPTLLLDKRFGVGSFPTSKPGRTGCGTKKGGKKGGKEVGIGKAPCRKKLRGKTGHIIMISLAQKKQENCGPAQGKKTGG